MEPKVCRHSLLPWHCSMCMREALLLCRDWFLNDEGWRPEHPDNYWNRKFHAAARACEAILSESPYRAADSASGGQK